jgi:hypothetical protein
MQEVSAVVTAPGAFEGDNLTTGFGQVRDIIQEQLDGLLELEPEAGTPLLDRWRDAVADMQGLIDLIDQTVDTLESGEPLGQTPEQLGAQFEQAFSDMGETLANFIRASDD